ncbi:oligosaccharide MFS transporter [Kluyvera ascorbata]|uniref:oligosaccharide MFS transporter n=1 Tax=Kluyvera ascorbata TaxID=51288 RepID=UPI00200CE78C|nr:oligosaccharide MFS transporter [Kluyvera ascorbata]
MVSTINKQAYIRISLCLFVFYFAWSTSWSFLAIWLADNVGLNSEKIGFVLSINALFALAMKPVCGYIMDKLGLGKHLLVIVTLASVLAAPFFIWVYQPLLGFNLIAGMLVGALYLSFAYLAGVLVFESYADRYSRAWSFEFGRVRMWGSMGWAVASLFAGQLFNLSPSYNFCVTSLACVVLLMLLGMLKTQGEGIDWQAVNAGQKAPVNKTDVKMLFTQSGLWILMLFYGGIIWMMQSAEQQFPRYFVSFFADHKLGNAMLGYMGSVQSAVEFILMFSIPWLINKVGARNGLLLAGFVIGLRLIVSALATHAWMIAIIKPFYGLEMALLLVSIFKYLSLYFDKRLTGTVYMVLGCFNYLGIALINPIAGMLYDRYGFAKTYLVMGVIAWVITLIGIQVLGKGRYGRTSPAPISATQG